MAALTASSISYGKELAGCKLTQLYVSAITDLDTVATGIPGIVKVMSRANTGASTNSTLSGTVLNGGALAGTRRVQVYLTNQATGEVTFESTTAGATCAVMVWHRG